MKILPHSPSTQSGFEGRFSAFADVSDFDRRWGASPCHRIDRDIEDIERRNDWITEIVEKIEDEGRIEENRVVSSVKMNTMSGSCEL